jgi:hypothetical protein
MKPQKRRRVDSSIMNVIEIVKKRLSDNSRLHKLITKVMLTGEKEYRAEFVEETTS